MIRITTFFVSIWLMFTAVANAQNVNYADSVNAINKVLGNVSRFSLLRPQEKVYMHFDNTGYFKGETIRFKAYVKRCDTGRRTDLSSILYVELINPSGDIVEKRKLKITNGEASGDITVDSIMVTGFYEIRAYTRYMTNWGTSACFSRVFPIFKQPRQEGDYSRMEIDQFAYRKRLPNQRVDADSVIVQTYTHAMTVRFFPEGGDLVEGMTSRVAFTVSDEEGRHIPTTGYLTDPSGRRIATVSTDDEGRGVFTVRPEGKPLYLIVNNQKDKEKRYELPAPRPQGCVLHLDMERDDVIAADIHSSAAMQGRVVSYMLIHDGNIMECDTMVLRSENHIMFPRRRMPEGVSQLTIFGTNGQIHAERMLFICPAITTADSINITSTTTRLTPCCKVQFDIQAQPSASISFSAMDAATMTNGKVGNMKTWMLLSSDVRGYIDHPDYYFEADDREHRQAADLLMMIQGWRRYDFRMMTGETPFEHFQPIEDKLYIFGQIKSKRKKYTPDDVLLKAYLYNQQGQVIDGRLHTDSLGNYSFIVPDVEGEWNLQMQSMKEDKARNYYICIDRHFTPDRRYIYPDETSMLPIGKPNFSPNLMNPDSDDPDEHISITKKVHVLPTVKVKARRIIGDMTVTWYDETTARKYSNIFYNCEEDADHAADEGEYAPELNEWLESKNEFFTKRGDFRTGEIATLQNVIFSDEGPTYRNRPILWVVENNAYAVTGVPYSYIQKPDKLDVMYSNNGSGAVEIPVFIDEIKSVYISEDQTLLNHYVLSSGLQSLQPAIFFVFPYPTRAYKKTGLRRTHFQGFNVPTEFKMEDYSIMPPMEDFRRTLFWAPDVKTDVTGKAHIEFYNNSSCQSMMLSAEGIDTDGHPLIYE